MDQTVKLLLKNINKQFSSHPELIKITGVDKIISQNKINEIVQGIATNLPFTSRSYDIVLNVESSHLYSDMNKFLEEVCRVLKPGGYFCWSDLRQKEEVFFYI